MIGKKFARLLVVEETERINPKRPRYKCLCDCGKTSNVEGRHLRAKTILSCGCLASEKLGNRSRTHGLTESPEYLTWCGIKRRCLNKNDARYPDYGGRGISICNSWANSFEAFLKDMGGKPTLAHSIERIDYNKGYDKFNCKWITMASQAKNRRSNVVITLNGKSMILTDWARQTGISTATISARIRYGWSIEDTLTKPVRGQPI